MNRQLYADLPAELMEADDILRRYGRWCRGGSGAARCGSAEGQYQSPADDEDRQPRSPVMPMRDIDAVRAALSPMPMMTRMVLMWLYVDSPGALPAKMRKNGLKPRHMQERHLEGVRMFWASYKSNVKITSGTIAIRSDVLENCCT